MKSLNTYINEWKLTSDSNVEYIERKYYPKSYYELRELIIDRYEKNNNELILKDIDVSNIRTLGGLYDKYVDYCGYGLFYNLQKVELIDVTGWDTSHIDDFSALFEQCYNLEKIIGLENFDMSKAKIFTCMFYGCHKLKEIDVSRWKLKEFIHAGSMFRDCYKLRKIKGIDHINYSLIVDMNYMFMSCNENSIPYWYDPDKWEN